ncbi:DrmB family protein [Nocardia sp. NPDC059246]|uniref:DrmB family protein n=1 Tax=unclassified Nocardia TaxID=2637762 RepID=UPI00368BD7DB
MSPLPSSPGRSRGGLLPEARGYRRIGAVRRAQIITTYGVGSLIAIDNGSYIVGGLDDWKVTDDLSIQEPRLATMLGVDDFRLPPAPPESGSDGIKVHRFPVWYSCPGCGRLAPFREFNSPKGKNVCAECDEELTPSRFIAACANGHVTEFPYRAWVHRVPDGHTNSCQGALSIRTAGTTASLRSVLISCECGKTVSMEGSFRRNALSSLKIRCYGDRPWLGQRDSVECTEQLRTLQRGSSAAWYAVVRSAISIPPWSEGIHRVVGPYLSRLVGRSDSEIASFLDIQRVLANTNYTTQDVLRIVRDAEESDGDQGPALDWPRFLREEYQQLHSHTPERDRQQHFVCEPPTGDTEPLRRHGISKSMLVHRLREVRALPSFTRITGPDDDNDKKRMAPLSVTKKSWLPAIEVIGEGVFLDLTGERLTTWEAETDVIDRANVIRTNHLAELSERSGTRVTDSFVTPRYLLLHTLAHALINEWSLDAGYPAASLRERLYIDDTMAGILIYTATSDSAGSLGGVVAQGEPASLVHSLEAALERCRWCSADPLCMESGPAGSGALNRAACHSCVMLPETSCETNNRFLDRALLIGGPGNAELGYFNRL